MVVVLGRQLLLAGLVTAMILIYHHALRPHQVFIEIIVLGKGRVTNDRRHSALNYGLVARAVNLD